MFEAAVGKFGLPSRVRSDKGMENAHVSWFMLSHPLRGPDRGSHRAGRSVHNQSRGTFLQDAPTYFTTCFTTCRSVVSLTPQMNSIWLCYIISLFLALTGIYQCLQMATTEAQLALSRIDLLNSCGSGECCIMLLKEWKAKLGNWWCKVFECKHESSLRLQLTSNTSGIFLFSPMYSLSDLYTTRIMQIIVWLQYNRRFVFIFLFRMCRSK